MIDLLLSDFVGTVSIIEIIWVTITGYGNALHFSAHADIRRDALAIERTGTNGLAQMIHHGELIEERGRIGVQTLFLSAGVAFLFRPASSPSIFGFIVALVFIAAALGMIAICRKKAQYRERVRAYNAGTASADEATTLARLVENGLLLDKLLEQGVVNADALKKVQREQAGVAKDLAIAQTAVEGVAADLAESHERAGDVASDEPAGAASDAASRLPEAEGGN